MIIFNSNVLKFGGFWLGFGSSPTPTIYRINVPPTVQHGTVSVNPTEGPTGTLVTISTVPDTGYELDTISLTGAELINGNQFYIDGSDVTVNVTYKEASPLPPIPANTIRLKYKAGTEPDYLKYGASKSCIDELNNIWDVTCNNSNWNWLFIQNTSVSNDNLLEVLGGNTSNVTDMAFLFRNATSLVKVEAFDTSNVGNMQQMFAHCSALTHVPVFNTVNATNMSAMFTECYSLKAVPLFNTSKVTNMWCTFWNCTNVESGALALYQQASSQATPPSDHHAAFYNCGSNTTTGAAELAQIPAEWKTSY